MIFSGIKKKVTRRRYKIPKSQLMHCASCEKKIKGNLRFEKGVKQIECDIPQQRVTITYDAEKTTPQAIIQSFDKFGYKATEVKQEPQKEQKKPSKK